MAKVVFNRIRNNCNCKKYLLPIIMPDVRMNIKHMRVFAVRIWIASGNFRLTIFSSCP